MITITQLLNVLFSLNLPVSDIDRQMEYQITYITWSSSTLQHFCSHTVNIFLFFVFCLQCSLRRCHSICRKVIVSSRFLTYIFMQCFNCFSLFRSTFVCLFVRSQHLTVVSFMLRRFNSFTNSLQVDIKLCFSIYIYKAHIQIREDNNIYM